MLVRVRSRRPRRPAFVLLTVLLVVVILSLAAYQYAELMTTEARAQNRIQNASQTRGIADSGIHYAMAALATPATIASELSGNPWSNPDRFQAQALGDGNLKFSILAIDDSQQAATGSFTTRYGVTDESGKIDLNALMQIDKTGKIAHDVLIELGLTEDDANSIVDWIDTDEDSRSGGAESQYYSALSPPYRARNGPLDSIEELLFVKGITPDKLFGNDRNRNGKIDPDDTAGSATLDRGLLPYLTIYSRESNTDSTGAPRVNINDTSLTALNSSLQTEVGQEMADYILAYRVLTVSPAGTAIPKDGKIGAAADLATPLQAKLSGGQPRTIASILSMIGTSIVLAPTDRNQPTVYVPCPLNDPGLLRTLLPTLFDKCTTSKETVLPGRININTAPQAVLEALTVIDPLLTDADISTILDRRPATNSTDAVDPVYNTPAWLLTEANIKPTVLLALENYITCKTQVYRVQSVGFADGGPSFTRVEAVIDANNGRPRILYYRDLSELGRAFDPKE